MAVKKLPAFLGGGDYFTNDETVQKNMPSFPAFMPGFESALATQMSQGFGSAPMTTSFGLSINPQNGAPMAGAPANVGMLYMSDPSKQPLMSQNPGGLDPNIVGPGTAGGGPMVVGTSGPIGTSGPGNYPTGVKPTGPVTPGHGTGVLPPPPVITPAIPKQVPKGPAPAAYVKDMAQYIKPVNTKPPPPKTPPKSPPPPPPPPPKPKPKPKPKPAATAPKTVKYYNGGANTRNSNPNEVWDGNKWVRKGSTNGLPWTGNKKATKSTGHR